MGGSRRIRERQEELARGETWRIPRTSGGRPRLALIYPNEYRVGLANLGLHALWEIALEEGAEVDRGFLPEPALQNEHLRSGAPILSLSGGRPLGAFDALLFSIPFEPDYVGLVRLLQLSGLEPLAERRPEGAPLVIAGGLAPSLNPEPIAPFCDLVGIGEAEVLLPLLELLRQRSTREVLLEQAARLPGWYAPARGPYRLVRQQAPLLRPALPVVISREAAFSEHVDVEISRGCRWRCRFCASGHVVAPYRELGPDELEEALDWGVKQRGRVGLVGTDVSDHSRLEAIVERIWAKGGEVAFPSLRVECLARSRSVAARLVRARPPRSLTLAVECASESLRCGVGKRLSEEAILRAVHLATEAGIQRLRLYFLVGVPGEKPEEVEEIARLVHDLLPAAPPGGITLSVGGLVPKAGTPCQWEPAPDREALRWARGRLRALLGGGRVELAFESPDWTRWEALLSLGGREVAGYLIEAADTGWRRALSRAAKEVDLLGGRGRWPDGRLPWQHVIHGPDEAILRAERRRILDRCYLPPSRLGL